MPAKKKSGGKKSKKLSFQARLEAFSTAITEWVGSNTSLLIHTIFFLGSFAFYFLGVPMDTILLVLTTAVSLEAIYLAIFIQIAVNKNTKSLREVEKDIDEIQEDVEEISEDIEEIQEDMEDIQENVDEIQEDVEEISEEDIPVSDENKTQVQLDLLQKQLQDIIEQLKHMKK